MKKHIPNTITCLNLFSGCIACTMAYEGLYKEALIWVIIAAVFDFFDGFSARLLHSYSPIGKELDSLADAISFGMAPGIVVYSFLNQLHPGYLAYLAFLIPVFSALRLAKFNIDTRQTVSFLGLATPANALFWCSGIYGISAFSFHVSHTVLYGVTVALILIFCLLMVSEIPMFSLKFKQYKFKGNERRYILIVATCLLFAFLGLPGISVSILLYILLSVFIKSEEKQ